MCAEKRQRESGKAKAKHTPKKKRLRKKKLSFVASAVRQNPTKAAASMTQLQSQPRCFPPPPPCMDPSVSTQRALYAQWLVALPRTHISPGLSTLDNSFSL